MSDAALYQTLKSVHIILVTSWFAGLFYLPRLLVYHAEAQDKPELEKTILSKQFEKMEKILFNAIMIPAFWLTWISGISLIYLVWWDSFGQQPWLHLKLAFVVCITTLFNSLFKVLCIFPSRYLFAIGLSPIFSFR